MTTTTARPASRHVDRSRGGLLRRLVPLLIVLAGVAVLLYPVAATQYNNARQRAFAEKYNSAVGQAAPNDLAGDLKDAETYNDSLSGVPILDPWLQKAGADPGSDAFKTYQSQLSRFDAMARIRVPSAGIDLPVYHGTSDEVLAKGAGHLYGTSLPVGGDGTHAVLTSHTGLSNATLFDHLSSVAEGDLMIVEVMGETLAYKVDQIKVVLPSEIGDLDAEPGHDYLTLFTCTPYAVNSHRLLVRGERVPYTPEMAGAAREPAAPGIESWMWLLIGGAVAGLLAVVVIVGRERRRRSQSLPRRAAARASAEPLEDGSADRPGPS
ncbi:class C sortase [Propionicicella superfundia]|uniref:class C sortase n=1 Tax=Propionicicella superfundia TaxID=348582 RepID=UPI0004267100|nr:class C sortase [Propionicicella superfundia]